MNRRVVLRSVAVSGLAPLLVACGSGEAPSGAGEPKAEGSPSESASASGSPSGSASGGATVAASDVPTGGGTVLAEEKVVVTQPADGDFKAFSAVCTHQGCTVTTVTDGTINCPCHGSKFAIEDGSVVTGPATRALENLTASLEGGEVTVS